MSTAVVDGSFIFFKHEEAGTGPALSRRFLALQGPPGLISTDPRVNGP